MVLPVLAVSYVAHTRYRRYSPRRLPTLTSMRVHEIYGYLAVEAIASGVSDELKREVLDDPDLWLLELTARSLKESDSDRRWTKVADPFIDPTIKEKLKGTRNGEPLWLTCFSCVKAEVTAQTPTRLPQECGASLPGGTTTYGRAKRPGSEPRSSRISSSA